MPIVKWQHYSVRKSVSDTVTNANRTVGSFVNFSPKHYERQARVIHC
jgi:hypothetical protein